MIAVLDDFVHVADACIDEDGKTRRQEFAETGGRCSGPRGGGPVEEHPRIHSLDESRHVTGLCARHFDTSHVYPDFGASSQYQIMPAAIHDEIRGVPRAFELLQQAQVAYDKVAWRNDVATLPESWQ